MRTVVDMTTEARPQIPYRHEDRITPPPDCHAAQDEFGKVRGWRESRSPYACLRWAAGKRCLRGGARRCDGCGDGGQFRKILDHPRMWNTGAGGRVLVGEPYDMGTEMQTRELKRLTETAAAFGLIVEEFPELSVWYPPYTSLLMVRLPSVVID